MKRYVLAITGATGPIIGVRVLKELSRKAVVHVLISGQSFSILKDESGFDFMAERAEDIQNRLRKMFESENLFFHDEKDFEAPVASGSFKTDGMFVVPCSMKTLSGIANGYANTLAERAADVTIKEGRPLLLCPREMPFSAIHLENMLKLARIGVRIAPPVIGFYHRPDSIDDMIDFIAGKLLDVMGIDHNIYTRWGTDGESGG